MPFFYLPGLLSGYAFGRLTEALDWPEAASLVLVRLPLWHSF